MIPSNVCLAEGNENLQAKTEPVFRKNLANMIIIVVTCHPDRHKTSSTIRERLHLVS